MTWDTSAQQLAVKVIGTVESNFTYDAVNYNDPITIGLAQWYGTRAAQLLFALKAVTPTIWTGVAATVTNDMAAHPQTDGFWNYRWLTTTEGESLKPVLHSTSGGTSTQYNQLVNDLGDYQTAAQYFGMDVNANTNTFILWCVAYHQSPAEAQSVLATAGPGASIDRLLSVILNDPIFSGYPNRYNTAHSMILAGNNTLPGGTPQPAPNPGSNPTGGATGATQPSGDIQYVSTSGNSLVLHYTNGYQLFAHPGQAGTFVPAKNTNVGGTVVQPPAQTPTDPPPSGTSLQSQLMSFCTSEAGKFDYGQGPGRLSPLNPVSTGGNQSGYTDCSGFCYYAYQSVAGINIGTWGGDQIKNGTLIATGGSTIDTTNLALGDLIFYEWPGGDPVNYDHTAMYAGGGHVWSHGGGMGPNFIPITGAFAGGLTPVAMMARRYI